MFIHPFICSVIYSLRVLTVYIHPFIYPLIQSPIHPLLLFFFYFHLFIVHPKFDLFFFFIRPFISHLSIYPSSYSSKYPLFYHFRWFAIHPSNFPFQFYQFFHPSIHRFIIRPQPVWTSLSSQCIIFYHFIIYPSFVSSSLLWIHPFIYSLVYSFIPSIHPSINNSMLSISLFTHTVLFSLYNLSIFWSFSTVYPPSIHLSIYPFIHAAIYPTTHPFTCFISLLTIHPFFPIPFLVPHSSIYLSFVFLFSHYSVLIFN